MKRANIIFFLFTAVIGSIALPSARASAQELVADLSRHLVAITTGFTGADVLLFGAIDNQDGEGNVVVTVRGPGREAVVRKKDRVAGIWINSRRLVFTRVPSFYAVAASKPLNEFMPDTLARRLKVGVDNLPIEPISNISRVDVATFKSALIRNQYRSGLFAEDVRPITFLGNRLFSTRIHFPANVPIGAYQVEVLLIRDGQVVSAQTTPLIVSKVGVSAEIFDYAHGNSVAYGLIAIVIAALAGWLAAQIFRRT